MAKIRKNNLKYIIRGEKRDLSKSCILGFEKAKYKNILVMDGDLQHKPGDIVSFLILKKKKTLILLLDLGTYLIKNTI